MCQIFGVCVLRRHRLGDAQVRVFGTDHPQQATQACLFEVDSGYSFRRLARCGSPRTAGATYRAVRSFLGRCAPDDEPARGPRSGSARWRCVGMCRHHDHTGEFVLVQMTRESFGVERLVDVHRPRQRRDSVSFSLKVSANVVDSRSASSEVLTSNHFRAAPQPPRAAPGAATRWSAGFRQADVRGYCSPRPQCPSAAHARSTGQLRARRSGRDRHPDKSRSR